MILTTLTYPVMLRQRMLIYWLRNSLSPFISIRQMPSSAGTSGITHVARDRASLSCRTLVGVLQHSCSRISTTCRAPIPIAMPVARWKTSDFQRCLGHSPVLNVRSVTPATPISCSTRISTSSCTKKQKATLATTRTDDVPAVRAVVPVPLLALDLPPLPACGNTNIQIDANLVNNADFMKGKRERARLLGHKKLGLQSEFHLCHGDLALPLVPVISVAHNQILSSKTNLLFSCGNNFSRTFRTVACHFDEADKSRAPGGVDPENEPEEVEWVHPDQRGDLVLESDPELKSMLRELAADFGREIHDADLAPVTSMPAEEEQNQGGNESRDSLGGKEATAQDKHGKDMIQGQADDGFEPCHSDAGKHEEKSYVFSIDDVVSILRDENAQDICVISIPKEKHYVDYFVVVTGRSPRHLKAMGLHINQQYKARKSRKDPFVLVEGEHTDDWVCIDFGNIVVHLMSEETRGFYELEKLWTLGPEYDDQLKRMREYDAKMRDITALETESPQKQASNENDESDQPTITFVR